MAHTVFPEPGAWGGEAGSRSSRWGFASMDRWVMEGDLARNLTEVGSV